MIVRHLEPSVHYSVRSPRHAIIELLIDLIMIASKKECSMTQNNNKTSIGIDISKARLDLYCEQNDITKSFENSSSGIVRLMKWFEGRTYHRIVLEPSGGYERAVLHTLIEHSFPVSLVHARSVKHFALAQGILAKTDKLDSRTLAQYGSLLSPDLTIAHSAARQELSCYVRRRLQLVSLLSMEKNRREKAYNPHIRKDIEESIAYLEVKISSIEKEIDRLLLSDGLRGESDVLLGVKGVAETTAANLLGLLPELGRVGNPQIAKLVGVAPMSRESGSWKGQRSITGGRAVVRKALYMATIVATVYNPAIRAYYQKLKKTGKKGKVALVAAMRKLLIILNGKMKSYYNGLEVY